MHHQRSVMPTGMVKIGQSTWSSVVEPIEASPSLLNTAWLWRIPLCLIFQCLVFCIGLNCVVAQSPLGITGSVLDSKTMNPVSGAVVLLAGTLHGSLTGSDGYFEFAGVNPGKYMLTVSAEGYTAFQESVEIEHNLELNILLMPKAYDLPDQHVFVNPQGGWSTRMFRGLLPRRVSAIEFQYTLYGSELIPQSFYLDGVRLIDPSMPTVLIADLEGSEVIPSPYNLGLGMDASIHFKTPEQSSTGAELLYDSRTRRVRSGMTVHRNGSRVDGTLSGIYETADNYSDGSGAVQQAGIRSGNLAGRVEIRVAPNHHLSGSGGWLQDIELTGGDIRQQAGIVQYKYSQKTGFLQEVVATAALQQLNDDLDREQRSGSISVTLFPLQNLRLNIGTDIYRYTESVTLNHLAKEEDDASSSVESSVFVTALHRISRLLIEGQFRLDTDHGHWGGMTFLALQLSSNWQLIAGTGRAQSERSVLRQADVGVRWNGFGNSAELMTFTRKAEGGRIHGMTALVRGSWWWTAVYTSLSDASAPVSETSLSTWARVHATMKGPLDLFSLGTEFYGTFFDSPAWMSADVWIRTMEMNSVSLQIGIRNLLDGTYTYPYSVYAEPGRSLQIALQYQRK